MIFFRNDPIPPLKWWGMVLMTFVMAWSSYGQTLDDIQDTVDATFPAGNGLTLKTNYYKPVKFDDQNYILSSLIEYIRDSAKNAGDAGYKVLYVSQDVGGGPNENGTEAYPFDSLSEALAVRNADAAANYIIYIDLGDYHVTSNMRLQGTSGITVFSGPVTNKSLFDVAIDGIIIDAITGNVYFNDMYVPSLDIQNNPSGDIYFYGCQVDWNDPDPDETDVNFDNCQVSFSSNKKYEIDLYAIRSQIALNSQDTVANGWDINDSYITQFDKLVLNSGSLNLRGCTFYVVDTVQVDGGGALALYGTLIHTNSTGYILDNGGSILRNNRIAENTGFNGSDFGMTSTNLHDAIGEAYTDVVQDSIEFYQYWNNINSAARTHGGRIWWSSPDTTVSIGAGAGLSKAESANVQDTPLSINDGQGSKLLLVQWDSVAALPLVDSAYNYIYYDYSLDCVNVTTDFYSISFTQDFTLGRAYRQDTVIMVRLCGTNAWNFNRRVQLFGEEVFPIVRASGMVVTEVGTRQMAVSTGVLWAELVNRFTTPALNTSTGDTFVYYYRDGAGGWTTVPGSTQISNTSYDDGDGTLGTVTVNQYGVHFVYIVHDGSAHVLYGQASYGTLADAQDADAPASIPGLLGSYGTLVAKIIVERNAASFEEIQSAFDNVFITNSGSAVNNIEDLLNVSSAADPNSQSKVLAWNNDGGSKVWVDKTISAGTGIVVNSDASSISFAVSNYNPSSETPAPTALKFDADYLNSGTYTQSGAVEFNTSGTVVAGRWYSFYFDGDNAGAITFNTSTESWRLIGVTDGGTLNGLHSVLVTAVSTTLFEAIFTPVTDTAP